MNKYILLAVIVLLLVYMLTMTPTYESDGEATSPQVENFTSMNLSGLDPTNPSIGLNHPNNDRSVKRGATDSVYNNVQMDSSHQPVGLLDRDPKPLLQKIGNEVGRMNIRDYNMAARRYVTQAPQKAVNMSEPNRDDKLMGAQKADCYSVNKEKCGLLQTGEAGQDTQPSVQPSVQPAVETTQSTTTQPQIEPMIQTGLPSSGLQPAAEIPPVVAPTLPVPEKKPEPKSRCTTCDTSVAPSLSIPTRSPPHRPETILRMNRPMHDEYSRQLRKSGNVVGNPDMRRVDFVEFYNNVSQQMDNSDLASDDMSSDDMSSDMSSDMSEVPADVKSDDESCDIASKCSADTCGSESLHPILDPRFNMREAAKQALLLEDHINNTKKRCFDCIRKHFLIVDGLLEEAVSLESDLKKRAFYRALYMKWIEMEKLYAANPLDSDNLDKISQQIRLFRKPLVEQYFDLVKDYEIQ
jgi:hypothetical protein